MINFTPFCIPLHHRPSSTAFSIVRTTGWWKIYFYLVDACAPWWVQLMEWTCTCVQEHMWLHWPCGLLLLVQSINCCVYGVSQSLCVPLQWRAIDFWPVVCHSAMCMCSAPWLHWIFSPFRAWINWVHVTFCPGIHWARFLQFSSNISV